MKRITKAECCHYKVKVQYDDGSRETLWRSKTGPAPCLAHHLVGLTRRCAIYNIRTNFLGMVDRQIRGLATPKNLVV